LLEDVVRVFGPAAAAVLFLLTRIAVLVIVGPEKGSKAAVRAAQKQTIA
jgi:hypothetical protein